MDEMKLDSIDGLLAYLAFQARTGDQEARDGASSTLNGLVFNLHTHSVTANDALSLQAFAVSLARAIKDSADDPAKVRDMCSHLIPVLLSAGSVLEALNGSPLADRLYFDEAAPAMVQ
ncbi:MULTISPECIES: hypothetical protein [unclassified Rhizobium]|uniref:hypothetical protein n=1 Tax=unclassified Rhizobium TaxID=2613769 RepID=UPI001ADB9D8E|nr:MULTISPECIES: hypothetical protein [unclassified Rhizobium]MBO9100337.1 hypothetical protein [Rhizobium sp. L58/93]MBO9186230.1 hypothetical protein [Rhizobium sp. E27B/91]QXZ83148.1 hypothetical protein J5287_13850 [Rhizobium sp. K1/93]QXZ89340.1 hypothetical protein J5280_14740 [Rhizobium sp. K15/93]QYA01928.1 hypothetical protein J5278_01680 [Rhizobium sp. B21/90]